jgi:hypothetical protein
MTDPIRSVAGAPRAMPRTRHATRHRLRTVTALAAVLPLVRAAAQQPASCATASYTAPATDTRQVPVVSPAGQAIYSEPGSDREDIGAAGVCVAAFDAARRTLVRTDTTDVRGLFELHSLPPGDYVLVVGATSLRPAAVALHVQATAESGNAPRLLVHLRSRGDPRASRITLVTDPALRLELLTHAAADQAVRRAMIARGADHPDSATLAHIDSVDAGNLAWMRSVAGEHGWPGRDLVGMDGSEAAFVLVQHAPHGFQKDMLPRVEDAYRHGDLTGQDLAMLTDRVLVGDGKPQRYGTQALPIARWADRRPTLYPIADSAGVDARRAQLGMPPLASYLEFLRNMYLPPPAGTDLHGQSGPASPRTVKPAA